MSDKREYPPLPDPLPVPVYDNHTHLGYADGFRDPHDDEDYPELPALEALDRAQAVGVAGVVQVGTDLASSRWGADLAERDARVLAAVAIHPNDVPELDARGLLDEHLAGIAELASRPRVRAVGETGLDWFRLPGAEGDVAPGAGTDADRAQRAQIQSFEAHIAIAKEHDLALQIHDRDAHAEVVEVLDRVGAPERTVFHCFSGDAEFARLVAGRGWFLSFAGTLTFKNAQNLRDALHAVPLGQVMVETDAPFLTPVPYRGRPNSAYLVPVTVRFMAEELGMPVADVAAQLAATTERAYGAW